MNLAPFTTLRLGGPAHALRVADSDEALVARVREVDREDTPLLLLGGGSNLVISDAGFAGVAVRVANRGVTFTDGLTHTTVTASAGEPWDDLVAACVDRGLAGIECLSGIPGSVGATPVQNVGAYGQEVADVFVSCRVWDRFSARHDTLSRDALRFAYRDSALKSGPRGRYVVVSVTLSLRRGPPDRPRYAELQRAVEHLPSPTHGDLREAVVRLRRAKGMVYDPDDPATRSAGSFFTNPVVAPEVADAVTARARALGVVGPDAAPPSWRTGDGRVKLAAGWLIERAGVDKGFAIGPGASVSPLHCLALVNRGGTSADLVALARAVRAAVRDRWGVELTPEPEFVGFATRDPTAP
ncbi:MAG: UDP-N-acetylmuramate dehydrogenase [Polyangiales bacterium]